MRKCNTPFPGSLSGNNFVHPPPIYGACICFTLGIKDKETKHGAVLKEKLFKLNHKIFLVSSVVFSLNKRTLGRRVVEDCEETEPV